MDFRNRGLSSEDFEIADHFSDRKLTIAHPARHFGKPVTHPLVDIYVKNFDNSSLLCVARRSLTGIALAPEPRPVTYQPKPLPGQNAKRLPSDLTLRYWWLPNLDKAEEARLVGLGQSGDWRAVTDLFKHFHKFILRIAGRHMRARPRGNSNKQTDGLFADLVAAGCLGFCEALRHFDLSLRYRFSTLAWRRIYGAISDEAVNFRKRGIKSESDAHRQIFRRSKRPVFKSFREYADAFNEVKAWGMRESYADDPHSGPSDDLRRGDAEYQEFRATQWTKHATTRKRDHTDELAIDADKRAARHLKAIGRQAYALELVERQQRQLAARAEPTQYLYPWKRPSTPASTHRRETAAVTRIINRQRKPAIRVWRAAA